MIDLSHGTAVHFLLTAIILFIAIFMRYLILAGLFYYFIHVRYAGRFQPRRISLKKSKPGQVAKEIMYSMISSFLFALVATLIVYSWQQGGTALYTDWHQYPWYWALLSMMQVLFIHETYYYWLHRWMHRPNIFKWIHRTHHESLAPTAWTSFSFHPLESLLQALPILLMIYFIPIHIAILGLLLVIMTITSVINHLNSELYPPGMHRHWFGKWWIGATHHALHHIQFHYNYGLYFTFWDHWMKTESPDYRNMFKEKTK